MEKEISNALAEVAKCDHIDKSLPIERAIFIFRNEPVMIDRDLADLYEVETKRINEQVKRNPRRFPERYRFQLTEEETQEVVAKCDHLASLKFSHVQPYAFTEQGVAMLATVLKSEVADEVSVRIMDAFVAMRRFISSNAGMFQRIESLERHQLETDQKIDKVLDRLEEGQLKEKAHIFSAGQIYEAKAFITELIGKAKSRVVLIDGYVSAPTIDLLDARQNGVSATIYTAGVGNALKTLCDQYNLQFLEKPLAIEKWHTEQHDRWLIIDDELWHCGASIRDAGVRTFGIDPIGLDVNIVLGQVGAGIRKLDN